MLDRGLLGAVALTAALCAMSAPSRAWDDAQYPDLKGQWRAIGGPGRFDISKPGGRGQQAPLTPEYQALFEANLVDQASGGQGTTPTYKCLSPGMPRVTNGYGEMEFVITPDTTYILVDHILDDRRIFTDGRNWPADLEPTLLGYSIGHWIDTTGSGHYDVLEVETRGFRGPRSFDASGIPLHHDNETVVKERIYVDKADPNVAHDVVTVYDHALTRPWTVMKNYRRSPQTHPSWTEEYCEDNNHVSIGKDDYMLSADGLLMPAKKDQPPPDLRYFKKPQK
ncbi:MAG TPA: hypothetical protein VGL31_00040 [Xanthobacteraceae bacterium]|jgi:hypothetical protein